MRLRTDISMHRIAASCWLLALCAQSGCALAPPVHEGIEPVAKSVEPAPQPPAPEIKLASAERSAEPIRLPAADAPTSEPNIVALPEQSPTQAASSDAFCPQVYPIDLLTALRLADSSNLQLTLARERITQTWVRNDGARALWLPSLR